MPESTPKTGRLKVRSDTLVGLTPQASIVTTPGTADAMPRARTDTDDPMPAATPADQSPLNRGDRVVSSSSHYSWKALQGQAAPERSEGGMMAGAGMNEMGDHAPMAGAVRKNKAPF